LPIAALGANWALAIDILPEAFVIADVAALDVGRQIVARLRLATWSF
jgi:hypothetical protein